jgi:hypothetical protein
MARTDKVHSASFLLSADRDSRYQSTPNLLVDNHLQVLNVSFLDVLACCVRDHSGAMLRTF